MLISVLGCCTLLMWAGFIATVTSGGKSNPEPSSEPLPALATASTRPPATTTPVSTSASPPSTAVPTPRATTKASPRPARTTPPRKQPPPPPEPEPEPDAYYANCAEARAAGAAPLYRGEPGYRSGLDRDGDGVACET